MGEGGRGTGGLLSYIYECECLSERGNLVMSGGGREGEGEEAEGFSAMNVSVYQREGIW